MRTLPRHISAHPDGWLVRVERGGVRYQAFVRYTYGATSPAPASSPGGEDTGEGGPQTPSAALTRALQLRDRFLRITAEVHANRHRLKGKSNTGWSGISETSNWRDNRPYPCFAVSWQVRRPNTRGQTGKACFARKMKRFCYGPKCSRERALQLAIECRLKMVGLDRGSVTRSNARTSATHRVALHN